ncbi:MAG: hypothetical protein WC002_05495 [Candidatus Muiribacteriota bacterium]|jgi:pyrimidine operon attenuation protein/uracil phosphoribosyltransferase
MKKWIFVFIALFGSIYSFFFKTETPASTEIIEAKKTDSAVYEKKIVTYKNINIHTPIVKELDNIELIGIDRKEMPVVYYKYDNSIKSAKLNQTFEEKYVIESIQDNMVIIKNLETQHSQPFSIK